jgi:hypothetical protein
MLRACTVGRRARPVGAPQVSLHRIVRTQYVQLLYLKTAVFLLPENIAFGSRLTSPPTLRGSVHYCMSGFLGRVVISVVLFVLSMLKVTSSFGFRKRADIARFATTYGGGNRDVARPYERRGSARDGAPPSYRPKQSQYGDNGRSSWNRYSTEEKPEPVYGRFDGDHVFGINSVNLALKSHRRTIKELIIQTGMDLSSKKDTLAANEILQIAHGRDIAIREFSKHDLNMMTDNKPHQGFVLRAEPLDFLKLSHLDKVDQFR